jgi:hypothetical protein
MESIMDNSKKLYDLAKRWLKANHKVLRKYKGQWIAYNGVVGIIAHDKEASKVMRSAEASGLWHIIKYLNPYVYGGLRRLVPIHFRPLHMEVWEPNVMVSISVKERTKQFEMLVDSGADITTVTLEVGEELGFERFESEVVDLATGVNGTVEYVLRNVQMSLEGHTFIAPVAWLLEPKCDDLLLGREVVFDLFDIEFKQKDETIIFKKRGDAPI